MTKKKIFFILLSTVVIMTSSIGIYSCYDTIDNYQNDINFNSNGLLYDIFSIVYPISFELSDGTISEKTQKYIIANPEATDTFYQNGILDEQQVLTDKNNIKYVAIGNERITGNTNDALDQIATSDLLQKKYQWYISLSFDQNGHLTYATDNSEENNQNYDLVWNNFKNIYYDYLDEYDSDWQLNNPTNFTIHIAIPTKLTGNASDYLADYAYSIYRIENIFPFIFLAVGLVALYTLLFPYSIEKEIGALKYPAIIKTEILTIMVASSTSALAIIIYYLVVDHSREYFIERLNQMGLMKYSDMIIASTNIIAWSLVFWLVIFTFYYIKSFFKEGFIQSFKNNTLIYWLYQKVKNLFNKLIDFDLSDNTNKIIIKIVIINFLIVAFIGIFDFNFILIIIYTLIILYFIKTNFDKIKNNYTILLNAVKHISNGNFNEEIHQDLSPFNTLALEFTNVKNGFEKAVREEVKSQKMKTELISNVSHDLKTPLTSIITYIDLLKNPDLDENMKTEYLATLDRNALRLKKLIEDLFEVSKLNSGNVNLNLVPVDIIALIKQAKFELDDQFASKQLTFKTNYPDEKIVLLLDSSKTYRIFQNLLINISRYALANTRVYLDVIKNDNQVIITFKNISADEIQISEAKLVERFVQGDSSRNTSGSGLGLSIAKSFTELQHGIFKINVDGDLFKATVIFNLDEKTD